MNDKLRSWDATDTPRRAGVSSLGVGGTNAHVILEEAPSSLRIETRSESASNHPELFVMSANSEKALDNVSARLKEYFNDRPEVSFADAAYTLKVGRRPLKYRRSFVASTHAELMSKLDAANQQNVHSQRSSDRKQKVAFMFAGGGAQYVNMARDLYNKEPVFKHHIDEALALIKEFVDFDLKSLIFADEQQIESASEELKRPSRSVTAVFVCQYAQAKLWMSWGVNPDALIGHSLGENTAACIAEVFSLKDALGLVALRGKLFEEVEAGGMVSVQLAESQVRENLPSDLDIAAINAQELTVVSGPVDSLAEYETYLKSEGVEYQRVHINIAAHSRMLEPILNSFRNYLKSIKLNEPKLPFISNVTGKWITAEDAMSADYWVSHLRSTVRFGDGVSLLMESNQYLLLEVGPGRILSSLAKAQEQATPDHNIFSSLPHADDDIDDQEFMMSVLGQLWCSNAYTDWAGYYGETTYNRVCLPTYPFEHKKYWVEPGKSAYKGEGTNAGLEKFEKLEDWLYEPVWRRSIAKSAEPAKGSNILVFAETEKFAEMAPFLPETNLVNVSPGTAYRKLSNDSYAINFSDPDAYVHLISDLQSSQLLPDTIIHVLPAAANFAEENYLKHRSFSFDSPFLLSQALANEDIEKKVSWLFVSSGGQRVAGEYLDNPMQSLSLGPVRVIPRELANVHCKLVDLDKDYSWRNALPLLMGELSDEFITDNTVAIRGSSRFNQSFERCRSLGSVNANNIVEGGVYIVTGGIGGLGLVAAKAIAEVSKVTLILISRSVFPSEDQWTTLIEDSAPEARQIEKINEIRQLGSSVKVVAADVSDSASMEKLKDTIQSEGGQIRGLIHTAGVINDSLIQLKELDEALDVLKPKVQGCIVLDQVFNFKSLDFAILYSSTSSFVGLAGQIDYAAANAFQDAFAHSFNDEGHVIALNWPAWKEVGMAASIASGRVGQPAGRLVDHPLLDRCIKEESGLHEFSTVFSVEKYWLLSEHRIKGANCLIPGTGFIELARAAYAEAYGVTNVAIQDAAFILPFVVDDTEQKELRVSIVKSDERCNFTIQSMSGGGWVEHATGIVSDNTATLPEEVSVESLLAGCNRGIQSYEDPEHHPHLEFGSRWACLDAVHYSDTEAVAKISVDRAYVDELKQFVYHPAVMDMATAGAQVLIDGYDPFNEFYVPISYGCLEIFSELPEHVFSYISYKKQSGAHSHDIARFDVSLYDSHGHPIMQVKDFTMQRVSDIDSVAKSASAETIEVDPTLARTLELGISQKDGSQALRYAINQALVPQLAVSVYDLDSLSKELTLPFGAQEETVPQHNPDIDPDIPKIEMLLKNHEAIEEVVIRSFLDEEDERRLIAFYVPDEWEQITTSELRRFAKEVLSEELLPKQFVELDELPLVDGNVDKSQLLDPLAPQDNFLAPRTSTEKAIAKIWQDVLGVSRIGLTDNFFDAGGHSLLSIRAIVRVEKKLGVRLDQAQMVLQTLEQIAKEIHNEKSENQTENNASGQGKDVVSEAQDADSGAKKKSSILKGLFSRGKN
ncbi:MAG: SDR family NAD(P)-dependent oxidoreductase [Pseudomonadales bacterium]|nr:SDR family NAD(P)-dependent oxidoreductase [Pseudomonadales bacterium]